MGKENTVKEIFAALAILQRNFPAQSEVVVFATAVALYLERVDAVIGHQLADAIKNVRRLKWQPYIDALTKIGLNAQWSEFGGGLHGIEVNLAEDDRFSSYPQILIGDVDGPILVSYHVDEEDEGRTLHTTEHGDVTFDELARIVRDKAANVMGRWRRVYNARVLINSPHTNLPTTDDLHAIFNVALDGYVDGRDEDITFTLTVDAGAVQHVPKKFTAS